MNIIIVGRHHGESKSFRLGNRAIALCCLVFALILSLVTGLGYFLGKFVHGVDEELEIVSPATVSDWQLSGAMAP